MASRSARWRSFTPPSRSPARRGPRRSSGAHRSTRSASAPRTPRPPGGGSPGPRPCRRPGPGPWRPRRGHRPGSCPPARLDGPRHSWSMSRIGRSDLAGAGASARGGNSIDPAPVPTATPTPATAPPEQNEARGDPQPSEQHGPETPFHQPGDARRDRPGGGAALRNRNRGLDGGSRHAEGTAAEDGPAASRAARAADAAPGRGGSAGRGAGPGPATSRLLTVPTGQPSRRAASSQVGPRGSRARPGAVALRQPADLLADGRGEVVPSPRGPRTAPAISAALRSCLRRRAASPGPGPRPAARDAVAARAPTESRSRIEPARRARIEEGRLEGVLGVVPRRRAAPADAQDHRPVPLDQGRERRLGRLAAPPANRSSNWPSVSPATAPASKSVRMCRSESPRSSIPNGRPPKARDVLHSVARAASGSNSPEKQ